MSKQNKPSLRFLWIPGRKKHQHKGRYDTTHKASLYSNAHHPKKNEPWTLGGSKGQEELLKSDTTNVLPGATASAACAVSTVETSAEETSEKSSNCSINSFQSAFSKNSWQNLTNNMSTLNSSNNIYEFPSNITLFQTNMDSIEHLNNKKIDDNSEASSSKCNYDLPDIPVHLLGDTGNIENHSFIYENKKKADESEASIELLNNKNTSDGSEASSSKCGYDLPDIPVHLLNGTGKIEKKSDYEKEKEKDKDGDAVVNCMYYSLMCCECNIS